MKNPQTKWIIYQYNSFIINYRFESNEFIVIVQKSA